METTEDGFLGGRVRVRQPKRGYRAGADPVLLAAAVAATPGDEVLELGCGVGVALLCLLARVESLSAVGVEVQADLADLARENLATNGMAADVVTSDLAELPPELRARSFDHVMANPPFFRWDAGSVAEEPGRETGRGEATLLSVWVDIALKRLKPGGQVTMIQRAERLPDLISAMSGRAGDMRVLPLSAKVISWSTPTPSLA